jgi:nucleoside phosphorylase
MAISTEPSLTIVAATRLEASAVRRVAPHLRVVEAGIALSRLGANELSDAVVTCGLAGGLQSGLATGTVVIPDAVATPNGDLIACDPVMSDALVTAARKLGHTPHRGSLLTSAELVNGVARALWAKRGYIAADMETGFVRAARVAAVRVILDTPTHELDAAWLRPASVMWRPWLWPQGIWLMREAPRAARIASEIVAHAFS